MFRQSLILHPFISEITFGASQMFFFSGRFICIELLLENIFLFWRSVAVCIFRKQIPCCSASLTTKVSMATSLPSTRWRQNLSQGHLVDIAFKTTVIKTLSLWWLPQGHLAEELFQTTTPRIRSLMPRWSETCLMSYLQYDYNMISFDDRLCSFTDTVVPDNGHKIKTKILFTCCCFFARVR